MARVTILVDEVTPVINALKARLQDKSELLDTLAMMASEHVHDRFMGQGRSRRYGTGPQPKWEDIHDVTRKIRRIRHGVTHGAIWLDTKAARAGIRVLTRTPTMREIGWPFGEFKNDYPYHLDKGVAKTGGMIPGKRISARPVLYFTKAFANKYATRAAWRWWLRGVGVGV